MHRSSRVCDKWIRTVYASGFVALACVSGCSTEHSQLTVLSAPRTVNLSGGQVVRERLALVAPGSYLVVAEQDGVDLQITAWCERHDNRFTGDSPVRRHGLEAIVVDGAAGDVLHYEIAVPSAGNSRGQTVISVSRLPEGGDEGDVPISAAWKAIAAAGAENGQGGGDRWQAAAAGYRVAEQHATRAGDRLLAAHALLAQATVQYRRLQEWYPAAWHAAEAGDLYRQLQRPIERAKARELEAAALMEAAFVARRGPPSPAQEGQLSSLLGRARHLYGLALRQYRDDGRSYDEARAINDIGLSLQYEGRQREALPYYLQARAAFERLGESDSSAMSWSNFALASMELGDVAEAAASYDALLERHAMKDDAKLLAEITNNSALSHSMSGRFDTAIARYRAARQLSRQAKWPEEEGRSLDGLGKTYYRAGELGRALQLLTQAAVVREQVGDSRGLTSTLRAAGNIHRELGEVDQAIALHERALNRAVSPLNKAKLRSVLAEDELAAERPARAQRHLEAYRRLHGFDDPLLTAQVLLLEGRVQASTGMRAQGAARMREAAEIQERYGASTDLATSLYHLARFSAQDGDTKATLKYLDMAQPLLEEVRRGTANPELRATFVNARFPHHDLRVRTLMDASDVAAALEAADRTRARGLMEREATRALNQPVDQAALQVRLAGLYARLSTARAQRDARFDRRGARDALAARLNSEIGEMQAEVDELSAKLHRAEDTHPQMLGRAGIERLGASLPEGAAAIEYFIGEDAGYAWMLSRAGVRHWRLPRSTELSQQILRLHAAIGAIESRVALDAELADVARRVLPDPAWLKGVTRLVVIPDGALHLLSFASLPLLGPDAAGATLGEGTSITYAPSLHWLALHRDSAVAGRVLNGRALIVADPVFDASDSRVQGAATTSSAVHRLAATAAEAETISRIMGAARVDRLTGFDARRDRLLSARLGDYSVIHLATHARADATQAGTSAVLLSGIDTQGAVIDNEISAAELGQQDLRADLLVLSACETALGRELRGEGVMGLANAALTAGARNVLGTLWNAPDQASLELIAEFYRGLYQRRLPADRALQAAQRRLRQAPATSHPFFWAGFVLIGAGGGL